MIAHDPLAYWCERYIESRPLSADSAERLRRSCRKFREMFGETLPDESSLSRFVGSLAARYAPKTVKGHRANILTIMRFAALPGGVARLNHDMVRNVRVPAPNPEAWEADEWEAFLAAIPRVEGFCPSRPRLSRAEYLAALAPAAYESGLRKGDLFKLDHAAFRPDGSIRLRQNKTSDPHVCAVRPDTLQKILAIPYPFPLRWTGSNGTYSALWREARELAGVGEGCTHQMRRNGATAVWERDPRDVRLYLGHRSENTWRHYVDQSRSRKAILPPE